MKESFVLELFQNIAVLISFVFLYDLYWVNKEGEKKFPEKIVAGLMIGIVGVIVIMTSWHLTAGVLVNSCTILLSLAGLAFGVVPTCVAMLGLILFRYSIGGVGVWIGISLILSSGLIGLLWRYFRPGWQNGKPVRELALMASTVYLCVIVNMLLLMPEGFSFRMLDEVMLFLFLVYIPFTVFIGVFMKKRAESWVNKKMLLESQSLYASLVENIPAGVFRKSKAGHFVFVNQRFCELQGLKREQIIGKNLAELFEQKTRNISLTPWKDKWLQLNEHSMTDHHQWILKNRNSVMVDEKFLKGDGEIGFLHVIKSPVFDENGQPIGSQGIQVDVTEQKKLESDLRLAKEKAEENDRMKTDFIHNISHEIRTPMNAIVGFSSLLNEPGVDEEQRSLYLNMVTNGCQELLSVVDDILRASLVSSTPVIMKESCVSLNGLFQFLHSKFLQRSMEAGVEFESFTGLPDEESFVQVDENKLQDILTRLLDNAFKFTRAGHVHLGYELKGDQILFYVKDTGIGIPKNMHGAIFELFIKVDKSGAYKGSGIGLSICKDYLKQMEGSIWVESEPGKGSCFYFSLPYLSSKGTGPGCRV